MIETEMIKLNGICYYQDELKSKIESVVYHPDSEYSRIEWKVLDSLATSKMYQFGIFYWDGSRSIQNLILPTIEHFTIIVIIGSITEDSLRSIEQQYGSKSRIGIVEIEHLDDVHLFTRSILNIIGCRGIIAVDFADLKNFFPVGVTHLTFSHAADTAVKAAHTVSDELVMTGGAPCKNLICTVFIGKNSNLLSIESVHNRLESIDISDDIILGAYVDIDLSVDTPEIVHVDMISCNPM